MGRSRKLTAEEQAALDAVAAMPDDAIDTSDPDAPEVQDWSKARRGIFYRPIKEQLTLRLDADVIQWFRRQAAGRGYQTRINTALREYMEAHEGKPG
jgi:uncharacterized protein (DUF4415 family)